MQAVVLLLRESGLEPLAPAAGLLEVGQEPLIALTLGWLERNGISEVMIAMQGGPEHRAPGDGW